MVKTFDKLPLPQVKRSDNSDNESGSSDIRKCTGTVVKTFDKLPLPQVKRSDNSDNGSDSPDQCCGSKYIEFLDPDPEFWPNLNPETELCNTY